jgi:hypothetical protein
MQEENQGLTEKTDSSAAGFGALSQGTNESGKEKPHPARAKSGNDKPSHKAESNGEYGMGVNSIHVA